MRRTGEGAELSESPALLRRPNGSEWGRGARDVRTARVGRPGAEADDQAEGRGCSPRPTGSGARPGKRGAGRLSGGWARQGRMSGEGGATPGVSCRQWKGCRDRRRCGRAGAGEFANAGGTEVAATGGPERSSRKPSAQRLDIRVRAEPTGGHEIGRAPPRGAVAWAIDVQARSEGVGRAAPAKSRAERPTLAREPRTDHGPQRRRGGPVRGRLARRRA